MVHPQRAEAYSPGLETNGEGAWRLPGEHALQWAGNALLVRRLGPLADATMERWFTPAFRREDNADFLGARTMLMPS